MNYSYTITRVDVDAKCMDVEFKADGFDPITVGVRLPVVGEDIAGVVHAFAPSAFWETPVNTEYQTVEAGTSGIFIAPTQAQIQQEIENAKMWEQISFEKKVAEVLVKFGVLQNDPTTIGVTNL